jgi:hypothetical protein
MVVVTCQTGDDKVCVRRWWLTSVRWLMLRQL